MDRTLQNLSQPLSKLRCQSSSQSMRRVDCIDLFNHRFAASSLAFLAAGLFGLMFVTGGCQTHQFGNLEQSAPPATLQPASMHEVRGQNPVQPSAATSTYKVRSQSPDGPGQQSSQGSGNRVKSLNAGPAEFDSPNGSAPSQLPSQQNAGAADQANLVADVIFEGNRQVPTHHLTRNLRTRPGRYFDPDKLQQDVDQLWRMPEISRIDGPYLSRSPEGVIITIQVVERNTISKVDFIGNRGISDRALKKAVGLADGDPLDVHAIRSAKTKIEELYKEKGYPRTQVEILEGNETGDAQVVFLIHEDQQQRIWKVKFEGNSIATDARLKNFIESKPGIMKVFGGLVKRDEIEQDILRLTNYYRSLGFFNARIGRDVSESDDGRWLTIRFIINEGPRYRVRNVAFMGNVAYAPDQLLTMVQLKPGEEQPEFNVSKMNQDVVALRDLYGGQGFVFANVEAEPRFLEEPGLLDIVYKIDEGKQYRAGNINVHFEGDLGITKREVVLGYLSIQPGDLIDARELRRSESKLNGAQVFASAGTPGASAPRIVVRPPELKDLERYADSDSGSRSRSRPSQGSGYR